jgi:hypothetical protein
MLPRPPKGSWKHLAGCPPSRRPKLHAVQILLNIPNLRRREKKILVFNVYMYIYIGRGGAGTSTRTSTSTSSSTSTSTSTRNSTSTSTSTTSGTMVGDKGRCPEVSARVLITGMSEPGRPQ